MPRVRDFCQIIHGQRQASALKIRQPLAQVVINTPNPIVDPQLIDIIRQETNIKEVIFIKNPDSSIQLDTNLTPELIAEGEYRDLVRSIQVLRKNQGLKLTDVIIVHSPSWPKIFEKEILSKTVASSIDKSASLSIELSVDVKK
jgi:isoleucyl-tRNA synthetase